MSSNPIVLVVDIYPRYFKMLGAGEISTLVFRRLDFFALEAFKDE